MKTEQPDLCSSLIWRSDIRVQRLKSRSCLHDKIFKFGIKIFRLGNTIVEVIFYEET